MSRRIFNATLNTILNIATNNIINSIASKLKNIIEYIQYTGDFISYLKNNFKITKTTTEEARHYTLKKVYIIHYISENGNWKKGWEKVFAIAERNYSSLKVRVEGITKYKYNGTIETREKLDETTITRENLDVKDSPNYNNISKLCLIAKDNYLNYINGEFIMYGTKSPKNLFEILIYLILGILSAYFLITFIYNTYFNPLLILEKYYDTMYYAKIYYLNALNDNTLSSNTIKDSLKAYLSKMIEERKKYVLDPKTSEKLMKEYYIHLDDDVLTINIKIQI
ncbi:hypothetical protein [Marinitoga lauensis]|uniref:hypothetical protein n=1 Tax=Marinitoga lauensis TaxID=2201189 RepID=UPI001012297D|nr:hypothetical protein [Marinitoga lauensis]